MTEYDNGWLTNLSEYIGGLNEELQKAKAENNYLREMLSESRQANEKLLVELKRYKSILQAQPFAVNLLFEENAKLREFASGMYGLLEMFDQLMGTGDNLGTPRPLLFGDGRSFRDVARELGIEVSE